MILGGNTIIPQGGAQTFVLNREALGAVAATKGDGYYKDPDFWREVIATFQKSGQGAHAQRKAIAFTKSNTASISFSPIAMPGEWKIREIVIVDRDGGNLVIEREDIPDVAFYDLTITEV